MLKPIQHTESFLNQILHVSCFSGSSSSENEPGISLQEQGSVCLLSQDQHCLSLPAVKWEAETRGLSKLRGWCQLGSWWSPRASSGLPCPEQAASEILWCQMSISSHEGSRTAPWKQNQLLEYIKNMRVLSKWEPSFIDTPSKLKFKVAVKPLHFRIDKILSYVFRSNSALISEDRAWISFP